MASRIYCGTSIDIVSTYLKDGDITIYGDSENNTITKEFIDACVAAAPAINCISLENIVIIEEAAFQGMGSLSNVQMYLPDTITTIGDYAFMGCGAINYIEIPSSLTDEGFGKYVFKNCPSLEVVTFRVPTKLTKLPIGTFQNCTGLNAVNTSETTENRLTTFPDTFTTIGKYAFDGCGSLGSKLVFPNSIQSIEAYAFRYCGSIQSITFGNGLNTGSNETGESEDEPTTELIPPQNITLCSKRQFRYTRVTVREASDNFEFDLPEEFKYCMYQNHFMIFKNQRLIPPNSVFAHSIDSTNIDRPRLYLSVPVESGDIIDVFYVTNDLRQLTTHIENTDTKVNENGETVHSIPSTNYIRLKSPLYALSSKHSLFVFLNGKKVAMSDMEDISDTIIKIMTDQKTRDRLEIFTHLDNEVLNQHVFIRDGLSHDPSKIKEIDVTTFETYQEPCKLDKMLNNSTDAALNKLFGNYVISSSSESEIDGEYYSKQQVLNKILEDFIISSNPADWIAEV